LKTSRLIVSLIGLAALALAYYTGSILFLAFAIIAFIGGLYMMGANRRPGQRKEEKRGAAEKNSK
jgi:hypothetical protein